VTDHNTHTEPEPPPARPPCVSCGAVDNLERYQRSEIVEVYQAAMRENARLRQRIAELEAEHVTT
jgi:hypothetical protein